MASAVHGEPPSLTEGEAVWRITLALLLGGAIGIQREIENHPAGLRTHILVSLGSALFTLISAYGFVDIERRLGIGYDPARIAAQVVSGIGFLGGGAIIKVGAEIRGLTTAGSLWVTSAIGMASALNFWFSALMTTIFVLVVLEIFKRLEQLYWSKINVHRLRVEGIDRATFGEIIDVFTENEINVRSITREDLGTMADDSMERLFDVIFALELPRRLRSSPASLLKLLLTIENLTRPDAVTLDGKTKKYWQIVEDRNSNKYIPPEGIEFMGSSRSIKRKSRRERVLRNRNHLNNQKPPDLNSSPITDSLTTSAYYIPPPIPGATNSEAGLGAPI